MIDSPLIDHRDIDVVASKKRAMKKATTTAVVLRNEE
jgi:hypothetical protein